MKIGLHLINLIKIFNLPKEERRLVFYSEGQNYWPHLEDLIREVLSRSNHNILYISSNNNDPGLNFQHPNYRAFEIDEGLVRDWLFQNIDTDIMVMTMPDLDQYQVKRSKHKVHYIYTQHSLVSFHMVYREGAFDHFDTIFCAGPHHIEEMTAMEKNNDLPSKMLVEQGYARLDSILKEAESRPKKERNISEPLHILVAPSWGPKGTIESGLGEEIVDQLIKDGHKVTLRPHPQTIKFAMKKISPILKKHANSSNFSYESSVDGQDSLHSSDLMVSDWSGAAFDYAYGLGKPVVFVDVPRKVNNPKYEDVSIEPFEVSARDSIGVVSPPSAYHVSKHIKSLPKFDIQPKNIFNIKASGEVGAEHICQMLEVIGRQ